MAHPKRKISKTRRDKRRTHIKAEKQQIGIIENYSIHSELENALLPMTLLDGYRLSGSGKLTLKYSGQKEYQEEVFFEEQIDIN